MVGQNAIRQIPLRKLLCLQRMHCKILFGHKYLKKCCYLYCIGIGKVSNLKKEPGISQEDKKIFQENVYSCRKISGLVLESNRKNAQKVTVS